MKTIVWKQQEAPTDEKERSILISEDITETKETVITLAQKENELVNTQQAVISAQERVTDLQAEIAEIKTALNIK